MYITVVLKCDGSSGGGVRLEQLALIIGENCSWVFLSVVFPVCTVVVREQQTRGRVWSAAAVSPLSAWQQPKMADFDAIYEDQDENSSILEAPSISMIPDPVIVRGAGNITVWVPFLPHQTRLSMWLRAPLSVSGSASPIGSTQTSPTCCMPGWHRRSSRCKNSSSHPSKADHT